MLRFLGLCLTFGIAANVGLANSEQVTTYTLDNGMDVVVIEDHRAPVVVHMVWYKAGAADEPPGRSGIAHFTEHLLFKATETLESGELSRTVTRNGGRDNAFTSFDYTAYHQRVAADRLELMMTMESDRMRNIRLTESDITTEREVIIEERNQRVENDPGALFREQFRAAQYLNHPYAVPVIGWRHEMSTLSMDDVMGFYNRHYAPNNATLVVAGDVEPEEVLALANATYGVIPANPDIKPRTRPQEPPQTSARRMTFSDPRVAQPYVMRSYIAPERDTGAQEEAAALILLAEILGGGQTSVFAEALQFDQQLAVYSGAWYSSKSLDDTTFSMLVVPRPGVSLQEAEDAMDATLAQFMQDGIDDDQLARLKMQMRAAEIYERDDVEHLANLYGGALSQGLTVQDVQDWPQILQDTTEADIMAAAKRLFDRKRSVTGWLMTEEAAQ